MNSVDRRRLKQQLDTFKNSAKPLGLDTDFNWIIEGICDPGAFFNSLSVLLTPDSFDSFLFIEGCTISAEAANFYEAHKVTDPIPVTCDMIFPVPDTYHLAYSSQIVNGLCELAANRSSRTLCNHIKGYKSDSVIFSFHDAFEGCLCISGNVSEATVSKFCRLLKVSYSSERRKYTRQNISDAYQGLLNAINHPNEVEIRGESFWKQRWERMKVFLRKVLRG